MMLVCAARDGGNVRELYKERPQIVEVLTRLNGE